VKKVFEVSPFDMSTFKNLNFRELVYDRFKDYFKLPHTDLSGIYPEYYELDNVKVRINSKHFAECGVEANAWISVSSFSERVSADNYKCLSHPSFHGYNYMRISHGTEFYDYYNMKVHWPDPTNAVRYEAEDHHFYHWNTEIPFAELTFHKSNVQKSTERYLKFKQEFSEKTQLNLKSLITEDLNSKLRWQINCKYLYKEGNVLRSLSRRSKP
jgi:hypothetical protein